MDRCKGFDTSAVASFSINDLEKIENNIYTLVDLVEKRDLAASVKEKEILLYAIEDTIFNLKNILDK